MVKQLLIGAALLVFVTPNVFGGDGKAERDRKARVALALASPALEAPAPKDAPAPDSLNWNIRVDPRDALVRVRQGDAQGSGTVVWSHGGQSVVLTAAHVVSSSGAVTVRGNGKTHPATTLARDDVADLAALLVAAELPAVRVSATDPVEGAEVMLIGMTSIWSKGRITAREQWSGGEMYLFGDGYESDSGDSGGGVFVAGELVGVHGGKVGNSPTSVRTPYAVGVKPIRAFLAKVFRRDGARFVPTVAPTRSRVVR